ncbi:hypothetical protein OMO38_15160 [Chryseobacterium sp. 09-1422]|uniref:Uncharacterized protein n=1 Tax=Chryseobacterium kimseyorum TaxID=2984028 RepID=A0ABT3I1G9_9FLAO|nr:hypothetical protein [Chryseobacterium kimseyorum]MCW3169863.1 hypothetical protein [Chryseobacterium kimseyorum]
MKKINIMKKILYSFLIFSSTILLGQKNTKVKFAICNGAVGTTEMFEPHKKDIESTTFFMATTKLPQHLQKFSYLAEGGLTELKFKKNVGAPDIMSLAALNEQSNVAKDTKVMIDGYVFDNPETNIYIVMVKRIDVKEDNGEKYLSIFTSDN